MCYFQGRFSYFFAWGSRTLFSDCFDNYPFNHQIMTHLTILLNNPSLLSPDGEPYIFAWWVSEDSNRRQGSARELWVRQRPGLIWAMLKTGVKPLDHHQVPRLRTSSTRGDTKIKTETGRNPVEPGKETAQETLKHTLFGEQAAL